MQAQTRLLLAFLAGYCDAATFVHMKGVFSAHVTGNFILFAAAMTRGVTPEDYLKLLTFPVFVLAVALATVIHVRSDRKAALGRKTSGLCRVLNLVALLLLLATALAILDDPRADVAVTVLVVLAMGMQNTLHHFIPGPMTTVMTGTVMNTVAGWTEALMGAGKKPGAAGSVAGIWMIAVFALGCVIAAFATMGFGLVSLALPTLLALWAWIAERMAAGKAKGATA